MHPPTTTGERIEVALKDIGANPFRGLENYPIQPKKVERLKESIQATGLWPRLMGRRSKNKVELAYAHHLWQALLELYGPNHKVPIEIRELPDEQMFQMMARENMTEWDTTPIQNLLTVKQLLEAYDKGEIQLPQGRLTADTMASLRCRKLTLNSINEFLGWRNLERVNWIAKALELMDNKLLRLSELEDISERAIIELITEIDRRRRWAEREALEAEEAAKAAEKEEQEATSHAERQQAKRRQEYHQEEAKIHREHAKVAARAILSEVAPGVRKGEIATKDVRAKAFEAVPPPFHKDKPLPPINQFADQLASELNRMLGPSDPRREKLLAIADNQKHLDNYSRQILLGALNHLSEAVSHWISRLDPKQNNGSRTPVKSAGSKRLNK